MPADSEVTLPHTFRPHGVRVAIAVLGTLLAVVALAMWFALPGEIRAKFTAFQIATVLFFGAAFYAAGYGLARSRLVAREGGLTVATGYRTRRLTWKKIIAVTLRASKPWA